MESVYLETTFTIQRRARLPMERGWCVTSVCTERPIRSNPIERVIAGLPVTLVVML